MIKKSPEDSHHDSVKGSKIHTRPILRLALCNPRLPSSVCPLRDSKEHIHGVQNECKATRDNF